MNFIEIKQHISIMIIEDYYFTIKTFETSDQQPLPHC